MIAVAVARIIAMRDATSAAAGNGASSSMTIVAMAPATVSHVTEALRMILARLIMPLTVHDRRRQIPSKVDNLAAV
jgi:hypothetical protein